MCACGTARDLCFLDWAETADVEINQWVAQQDGVSPLAVPDSIQPASISLFVSDYQFIFVSQSCNTNFYV